MEDKYKVYQFKYNGGSNPGSERLILVFDSPGTITDSMISGVDSEGQFKNFLFNKMVDVVVYEVNTMIRTMSENEAKKLTNITQLGALGFGDYVVVKMTETKEEVPTVQIINNDRLKHKYNNFLRIVYKNTVYDIIPDDEYYLDITEMDKKSRLKKVIAELNRVLNE